MTTPRRHVCVHAHFYQPPRENPWLGEVEREESAAPFHDWNCRIAEECYGPAALGERRGSDGRAIADEVLLSRLSFNFGPTLLDWLERRRPTLYRRILDADRASAAEDGLGNAIAQPYFHAILPLAPRRDQETLVRWGLSDFRTRFGRDARGMWLPETAVDDETLDVLAAEGVGFTILDPAQAASVRELGGEWRDVSPETLDPKLPYLWISPKDPSRRLAIFFYHRRLSLGVVSGETLADPAAFAEEVRRRMFDGDAAQLVHVASDGEFYGHHLKGQDRALALALDLLAAEGVETINLSRFLALFPPPRHVRIKPRTSWSCAHGLGRWERDCGCRSASLPDWRQDWRGPLRAALDALARRLDAFYEDDAGRFFAEPWALRDASAALWRETDPEARRRFLDSRARRPLSTEEASRALRLLALQRERLAMFTSCGWFFDDVSGVEAAQILQRAARACELAQGLGENVEEAFVERLAAARSNMPRLRDGAGAYRRLVAPTRVGLDRAAAHAALLDHVGLARADVAPALRVELGPSVRFERAAAGGRKPGLSARLVRIERPETLESAEWHAIVHRGDALDFAVWLAPRGGGTVDVARLETEFLRLDGDALRAALDARFGPSRFGLDAVLPDDRAELARGLTPGGALGPERAAFLSRWCAAVTAARGGGRGDDAVLELLDQARERAFLPEELPWAGALEDVMHERLADVLAGGGPAVVSRGLRWLDVLGAHGLIRGRWRLRDFQRRWSEALAESEPSAERDACRALGERLGLTGAALAEARW
jgi:alpha-amylase/alpha-mannosidase (GH57 family)